jgi:hypothetical protein
VTLAKNKTVGGNIMTQKARLLATAFAVTLLGAGAALAQEPIRIGAINP